MKKDDYVVDYAIYRQVFLLDVKNKTNKLAKSKFLLVKKSTKIKMIEKLDKLAKELEKGTIKNKDLVANRRLFNKFYNEIQVRGYLPYLITFLVLILAVVFVLVLIFGSK